MDLKIRTRFAKKVICFIIKKVIKNKFGVKVKFRFAEGTTPSVITDEKGVSHISIAIEADVKEADLEKVIDKYDDED